MSNENDRENYETQPIGSGKTHSSGLRLWNEFEMFQLRVLSI
jgi:hypothetical protein